VVHAVAIRVCQCRGAVGVQTVLPEPGREAAQTSALKFIRADIHPAARDAEVAVEVGGARHVSIIAGIDAWGIGLEPQISCRLVDEQRLRGPTRGQYAGRDAVKYDTVVQRAASCSRGVGSRVADQRAIVERAVSSPAAVTAVRGGGRVAAQSAVVERAPRSPAAAIC